MKNYVFRRVLMIIPTFLIVTILVFLLVRLIPGSAMDILASQLANETGMLGEELSHERLAEILGLDDLIHIQYGKWLGILPPFEGILEGNLGDSIWSKRPIVDELFDRIPVSFELGLLALLSGMIVSIPIGIFSAMRQDTIGDYIFRSLAIISICLPTFWLGTMVMVYPSIWWNWSPAMQYIPFTENPGKNLLQFIVPAVILGLALSGTTMRMTRTMMLEVLRQDYIRTAWSKGLRERTVVIRHALKNTLLPVITIVGMMIPLMIGGSVILEKIFGLPGVGRALVEAINTRDYIMISGINVVITAVVLLSNLAVDLTYGSLDPRIQMK